MKLIYCSIIGLYLLSVPVFAQDTQQIQQQEDRSYLKIFTKDEQCIIRACEGQLNGTFFIWYADFLHKPNIILKDIASAFLNFKSGSNNINIDTFFEYLKQAIDIEKHSDIGAVFDRTKTKVWADYNLIKVQKSKQKQYDDKQNDDLINWLINTSEVKAFIQELLNRYPKEFERR